MPKKLPVILIFLVVFYFFQYLDQNIILSNPKPTPAVKGDSTIAAPQATISGEIRHVVRVIDGDTIVVDGNEKIRYIGMNTPEKNQCYFKEATDANKKFVEGKDVVLQYDVGHFDRYGRTLAYVYADNTFVNEQLLLDGYAQIETIQPNVKYAAQFLKDQEQSRDQNKGLWNPMVCPN